MTARQWMVSLSGVIFPVLLFFLSCGKGGREKMLEYYRQHGVMTDPGVYEYMYADLPSDIPGLCRVTQGAVLHIFWAKGYGVELSEERKKEVGIRKMEGILAKISGMDHRTLAFSREPEKRVVGNCRDFSIFLVSLLRREGFPARARCGFATYFTPGRYEDHWICEYWNEEKQRWIQVDAQLDSLQLEVLKIDFDPHDLPEGKFLTGGEAWRLCRSGELDAELCGIFDMKGLWFVQGDLVRDFMALNKLEVLPWDCNNIMGGPDEKVSQDAYDLLDRIAGLTTGGDKMFRETRSLYESRAELRMPHDWQP
jgi:hypothetical protein